MMNRLLAALFLLPVILGTAACSSQAAAPETSTSAEPPAATIAQMPEDADPALWVLKDEDTTIYMFGTVHILKPGLTWFDEAVKDAFDKSDELVVEMIEPDATTMVQIINDIAIDKSGISLRDKLSAEDRVKYEAALAKLNLPPASFDPLDPWFASVSISLIPLMSNGYDVNSGVEKDLKAQAELRNMKIVGLETPEQQLGFFDNLPEEVQIGFLNFTISTLDDVPAGMENMVAQWANANVEALAELMNAGLEDRILYDTLLADRNATWAEWVEQRMDEPGTLFMAVGAGHLAGESSLQEKLKAKGFKVKRLEY
ncbi:MAG: TraB/GumN family protein [Pseudomonadota bacterium]